MRIRKAPEGAKVSASIAADRARVQFECDLDTTTGNYWPRVRYNFSNGWTASVIHRTRGNVGQGCDAMTASLACWPTGHCAEGKTEIGETEASADEVAAYLAEIAARPRL